SVDFGKKNRQAVICRERGMQVLKESERLRKHAVFRFSDMTMHLVEDMQIGEFMACPDLDSAAFRLPDVLTSRAPKAVPYLCFRTVEIDPVPRRFTDLQEALVVCRQLIAQAAERYRDTQRNQRSNKLTPGVGITS